MVRWVIQTLQMTWHKFLNVITGNMAHRYQNKYAKFNCRNNQTHRHYIGKDQSVNDRLLLLLLHTIQAQQLRKSHQTPAHLQYHETSILVFCQTEQLNIGVITRTKVHRNVVLNHLGTFKTWQHFKGAIVVCKLVIGKNQDLSPFQLFTRTSFWFSKCVLGIFSNNAVRPHTYQGRVIKFHRSTIWQLFALLIAYFQPLFHGNFLVNTSQVDQISLFQIILGWKSSNQCTGQGSQLNFLTQQSKIMRVCTFATLRLLDGTTTKGV